MKISKIDMQSCLSKINWDYREIFLEKSKSYRFTFVNWKFKTPVFSTLEWVSFLSRTWDREYFKVFSWESSLDKLQNDFTSEFWLERKELWDVNLEWEDCLELPELDNIEYDFDSILKSINYSYEKYIKNNELVVSIESAFLLSNKSFIVWNSDGRFVKWNNFYNTLFVKVTWKKWDNYEEVFEKITWCDILDKFDSKNIDKLFNDISQTLKTQLDADKSPSWVMDVIIWNEAGWTIIHEAVGHWLEADLQNSSVYKDKLWQKVASELVSIVDNPTTEFERWYYVYDHEWNKAKNATLIEKWVLKSYLHNKKTSQKFWVETTSHGRKETYKHKTLVRMWNTYMLPWKDKKEDLIKKVENWIYVSRMWWWQVNTTTWDFVFEVQNGYLIENWELTRPIRWATLSWNWPKMLEEVYWVCDDLVFFDGGTCWKWQSMPVSEWNPTFLTKLKVSSI